jgi:hypothetical protein
MLFGFLLEMKKGVLLGEWELPPDTVLLGRVPPMKLSLASQETNRLLLESQ